MITINSESTLSQAIGDLRDQWKQHKYLEITVRAGKDRSIPQNSISHKWYQQIANELREGTALDVKNECKLHYGVPILRAENPEFRERYDTVLKPLSYEKKLLAMNLLPVTSLMTKAQLSQYLVTMQSAYAHRVRLEFPEVNE